jgi:hypothetical protein
MMRKAKQPLTVALYGMDSRTINTMDLFLQGPCAGAAVIATNPKDADIDIFEGDTPTAKRLLKKYLQENQQKPLIILSLWDVVQEDALHVKKPINAENMLSVLNQAKKMIDGIAKKAALQKMQAVDFIVVDENLEKIAYPKSSPELEPLTSKADTLDELGDWFETGWADF